MRHVEAMIGKINVEIDGLASAAAIMRDELKRGYRTQVPHVHDAMRPGATIGGQIVGADWVRLQDNYTTCIEATVEALYNLDVGTQAVARAAEVIARAYRDSDALARATVDEVRDALPRPPEPQSTPDSPGAPHHG